MQRSGPARCACRSTPRVGKRVQQTGITVTDDCLQAPWNRHLCFLFPSLLGHVAKQDLSFFLIGSRTSAQKTHQKKHKTTIPRGISSSVKLRKAWMHGSMQMIHLCSYNILKIEKHSAYQIPALLPNMAATKNGCFAGRFRQKCTVPASFQLFGGGGSR